MLWVIAGICSVLKERNRGGSHNASCLYPIHLSLHPHPHTTVKWYLTSRIQTFTETSLICDWATRTRSELTPTNQVGRWHNVACALAVSMATLTASSLNQQKVTIVRKLFSTDQWMCICNISIEIDVTLVTIIYLFNHYGLISTVCVAYFDVLSRVFSYCITIVQSHKISSICFVDLCIESLWPEFVVLLSVPSEHKTEVFSNILYSVVAP